ncbi:MAG: GvpL/GvpF family gas vesicle protein [Kofleriaceae bacterium]
MELLIYGIVRAAHPEPPGAPRLVRSGPIAAVVRDLPDDAALGDDDIVSYFDALVALMAGGPVLPVRFGTLAPDDGAVCRELLDADPGELAGRLEALDGLVEVWLHLEADLGGHARELLSVTPGLLRAWRTRASAGGFDGQVEVGEAVSGQLSELRDALSEELLARLEGLAVAHKVLGTEAVTELRHAYLVSADRLPAFDAAVQQLRDALGAAYAIEYVGPLPPFEFTDVEPRAPAGRSRWGW